MSLRKAFSNSVTFKVITKDGKGAVVEIKTVFRQVYDVACRRSCLKRCFLDLYLVTSLRVRNFGNT